MKMAERSDIHKYSIVNTVWFTLVTFRYDVLG
jgi:hypothetical protein